MLNSPYPSTFKDESDISRNKIWQRWAFEFANNYGASVVQTHYTAPYYEVAVLHFGVLCEATYITNDVIPGQDNAQVNVILDAINALPERNLCTHKAPNVRPHDWPKPL